MMREDLQAIRQVAEGAAAVNGCEVWEVELGRGGKGAWILRVFIDRPGGVSLHDCEAVSKDLSARLDVDDPIEHRYVLEVSSPGITRALTQEAHFLKSVGHLARIVLKQPFEGSASWDGRILDVKDGQVRLQLTGTREITLPLSELKRAQRMFDEARKTASEESIDEGEREG